MNKKIQLKPEPSCPSCGARMVLRRPTPPKDFDPFWGCNRFPNCKGTLNIDFETGQPIDKYDHLSAGDGWEGDLE